MDREGNMIFCEDDTKVYSSRIWMQVTISEKP
jgi:hypothetical protein